MNSFYIIANQLKPSCREYALKIQKYLEEKGKICYVQLQEDPCRAVSSAEQYTQFRHNYTDASKVPSDVECVLVLGGDGTLLHAARDLVDRSIPMLGINLGTLGYLAGIESNHALEAIDRLIEDAYLTEERMMLTGTASRGE